MNRCLGAAVCALSIVSTQAFAQGAGEHGGGSAGCGDLFGDLVHVKRLATGEPVLEMRWVGYPEDAWGWAFCPIPLAADGVTEIGFWEGGMVDGVYVPPSCDATADTVEVDYFGRLSAGRTKERNIRMHFDEVISTIMMSTSVERDEVGRLRLLLCDELGANCSYKIIDSPQENLALYQRVMKYGHIQTNEWERDVSAHGDPKTMPQYHPALRAEDWLKFAEPLRRELLPYGGVQPAVDALGCFSSSVAEDGKPTAPENPCAPEELSGTDLVLATGFLGGAADKTGKISGDLVQYLNRIVKITKKSESAATLRTLPARIRTCNENGVVPQGALPEGVTLACETLAADEIGWLETLNSREYVQPPPKELTESQWAVLDTERDEQFARAKEKFVDFGRLVYDRSVWFNRTVPAIVPAGPSGSFVYRDVPLLPYLQLRNPDLSSGNGIDGFVNVANDSVRAVEFVHNYAVPDDLGLTLKPLR